ncbi:MAG: YdbL family protein [Sphingomonadaceae bacterium]|nr:YdbL family protein [Sphingomonadaceae bacterium]
MRSMTRNILAATALVLVISPAMAQRDPAYQAARAAGQVGEMPDGYLGIVSGRTAALQAMVDDLNLRRRSAYTERARSASSTVEQMAFVAGCNLIAQTAPGEKYMGPDGAWHTRDGNPPQRDSRCI